MELHLIRHGQTNWNEERRAQGQSDSKLTKIGKEQAIALGKKIKQIKFDKIFAARPFELDKLRSLYSQKQN